CARKKPVIVGTRRLDREVVRCMAGLQIKGQTNKSGAVYLFDRKETGISSMVRRRKSFRHLTIETIYDR
ncbi:MAG: hypothetical protein AAF449_16070, partial [Myxococcota bacterium]